MRTAAVVLHTVLLTAALAASPAAAQKLWTEGPLDTGIQDDTPVTFGAFRVLAKQSAPAVVSIATETRRPSPHPFFGPELGVGAGSGFIIRSDGYVLSNNHVVEDAQKVKVHLLDGRIFDAKVVGSDPATDLSLLKIDAKGLPVVPLGDSDRLEIGDWVMAIGNPMGLSHTVTAGIVSAKGRREVNPDGRLRYPDFIQTDASINPGNSGGPLFNLRGEVVGINTAINARAQGIGFAIPINMVKALVPDLAERGRVSRSWLGIQIQEVTPELAKSFRLQKPQGALIARVVPNGPADAAGIRPGDVVVGFDGRPIHRHDDLPWIASTAGIGKTVEVTLLRDGKERSVRVKLGRLPDPEDVRPAHLKRSPRPAPKVEASELGITVVPVDPKAARNEDAEPGGAQVSQVDPGSVAAQAGLRRGDIIVRCNGARIVQPGDLVKALRMVEKGELVRLLVEREGGRSFIAFTR